MAAVAVVQIACAGRCPRAKSSTELSASSRKRLEIPNSRRIPTLRSINLSRCSVQIQDQE
jgi:hypothetical protein